MLANLRLHAPMLLALALAALSGCDRARPIASPDAGEEITGDVSACAYCHGDASRPEAAALLQAAPPRTATGAPAGAHHGHLHAGTFRSAIACAECHVVPRSAVHLDGRIDVAFGALARTGGAAPSYAAGTCSGVYCHGATLAAGGTGTSPSWTGALDCSSCHAFPPPSHAATDTRCATCHPGTVYEDGRLNLSGGLHVNGVIDVGNVHAGGWAQPGSHGPAANADLASCRRCHGAELAGGRSGVSCDDCHAAAGFASWRTNCTFCHGMKIASYGPADLAKAAPPKGTQGELATSARAVGAHQKHLLGGAYANALSCATCHAGVASYTIAHVDGTRPVGFGGAANANLAKGTWNPGTGTGSCSATWCHGAVISRSGGTSGGTNTAPSWTASISSCTSCHSVSLSSLPNRHSRHSRYACGDCHSGYSSTAANKALHVNGVKDVGGSGTRIATWNGTSCTTTNCHSREDW